MSYNIKLDVFEGPLDSFLFKNSIGNAGATKRFPLDIPVRYWYDDDDAGRKKSIEMINKNNQIFLWEKFKNDIGLPYRKKWDLNEVMIWLRKNNKGIPNFNMYFSDDPLDIIDL